MLPPSVKSLQLPSYGTVMNGDVELRNTQSQPEADYAVDLGGDEDEGVVGDNSAWADDDVVQDSKGDEELLADDIEVWD